MTAQTQQESDAQYQEEAEEWAEETQRMQRAIEEHEQIVQEINQSYAAKLKVIRVMLARVSVSVSVCACVCVTAIYLA